MPKNQKHFNAYCNIFANILKEICPAIAPFFHLKIEMIQIESQNSDIFQQQKVKWKKTQNIHGRKISLEVWIDNEEEFSEMMSLEYQENGKYLILDMLMSRILDEIILLLRENLEKSTFYVNYPKDALDLLNQTVTDLAYYIGMPILHGINYISSMSYEGIPCDGRIIFIRGEWKKECDTIELKDAISFHENNYRIIRKILQVARQDKYAVYDMNRNQIVGLATKNGSLFSQSNYFTLEFRGHMHWVLQNKKKNVIQYINGSYHIVDDIGSSRKYLMDLNFYYNGDEIKVNNALQLIKSVSKQSHGTMVIISSNAKDEVTRLSKNNRAIKIEPINLIEYIQWIYSITSIDGALMLDENLNCYAIGTLLDGPSTIGDISRGARFNSALSYVHWRTSKKGEKVLAIIVSEDKMISTIIG